MKCLSWVFLLGCLIVTSCSDSTTQTAPTDAKVQDLGIPTLQSVDQLEERATELFTNEKWDEAASALDEYVKQATRLSNLIVAGLAPAANNASSARRDFNPSIAVMSVYASVADGYIAKRNRAIVMRAECFSNLGQTEKAVSLLVEALEFISIDNEELWTRARDQLYSIIGIIVG